MRNRTIRMLFPAFLILGVALWLNSGILGSSIREIVVPRNEQTGWNIGWNHQVYRITQEMVKPDMVGVRLLHLKNSQGVISGGPPTHNGQIESPGPNLPLPTFVIERAPALYQFKGVVPAREIVLGYSALAAPPGRPYGKLRWKSLYYRCVLQSLMS